MWILPIEVDILNAIPLKKKMEKKNLIFDSVDENKEVLKNYTDV